MAWRCPACQTEVKHDPMDGAPKPGTRYRCFVCRLDLVFIDSATHMEIAPMESDHAITYVDPRGPRTFPSTMTTQKKQRS